MIETRLSHLLYGSDYFMRVDFGGDREKVQLAFGPDYCTDFVDEFGLDDLNTLIYMLSTARDELESRQPTNKETA